MLELCNVRHPSGILIVVAVVWGTIVYFVYTIRSVVESSLLAIMPKMRILSFWSLVDLEYSIDGGPWVWGDYNTKQ